MRRWSGHKSTRDAILLNYARARFPLLKSAAPIDLIVRFHRSYRDGTKRLRVCNRTVRDLRQPSAAPIPRQPRFSTEIKRERERKREREYRARHRAANNEMRRKRSLQNDWPRGFTRDR